MKLLDLTLPTAAENLALDEALLEQVDRAESVSDPDSIDILRVWEPIDPVAVIGRASKVAEEVDLAFCNANQVAVLRRCSGGASVVCGAGCLMYGVVLSLHRHPELRMIEKAHAYVLERIRDSLLQVGRALQMKGTSDLTLRDRKVSGNSLRCKRNAILYHGTVLCEADLEMICQCLQVAPRQPEYRNERDHAEFIANLSVPTSQVRRELINGWPVTEELNLWPRDTVRRLVAERYSDDAWNFRL